MPSPALQTPGAPPRTARLRLHASQVDRVVHSAGPGAASALLAGLPTLRERRELLLSELDNPRLSRSLLSGLALFAAVPATHEGIANAELANLVGMPPSSTYRYLHTLLAAGLIERDISTRRYRIVLQAAQAG